MKQAHAHAMHAFPIRVIAKLSCRIYPDCLLLAYMHTHMHTCCSALLTLLYNFALYIIMLIYNFSDSAELC